MYSLIGRCSVYKEGDVLQIITTFVFAQRLFKQGEVFTIVGVNIKYDDTYACAFNKAFATGHSCNKRCRYGHGYFMYCEDIHTYCVLIPSEPDWEL
jgi:hypothetical protein